MKKIKFVLDGTEETEFFVLEQTRINGISYLLVSDSEDDEAECLILKDTSTDEDKDSIYEIIEDETELLAVSNMFEELLEDTTIEI